MGYVGAIILLLLVGAAMYLYMHYLYIAIPITVAAIIIGVIYNNYKKEQARQKEEDTEQRNYQAAQTNCFHAMVSRGEEAISEFESMLKYVKQSERCLDQAKIDFTERAFNPFWNSIQNAAESLAHFDECSRGIGNCSSRYIKLTETYEGTPPKFPLSRKSVAKMGGAATKTAERMQTLVRNAQRDFQFATIYEQYKTNKILVAGFSSLERALDNMVGEIVSSIESLTGSIDVMKSTLNSSLRTISSQVDEISELSIQHHNELSTQLSQAVDREKKTLEMLDDFLRERRERLL